MLRLIGDALMRFEEWRYKEGTWLNTLKKAFGTVYWVGNFDRAKKNDEVDKDEAHLADLTLPGSQCSSRIRGASG